jgi:protein-S-isoprenylcysteine O-methyltransferase Ste14
MPLTWWITAGAWAVFLIYWFYSSLTAKRTVKRDWVFFLTRIVLVVVAIWLIGTYRPDAAQPYVPFSATHPVMGVVGAALVVVGIAYAIYARYYLGRNWGMPRAVKENPELVTTGPYAQVRHPIYTGVILAVLGSALTGGWWWIVIFIGAAAYYIFAATQEEKLLAKTFPDTYPAYKARTKMLVPYLF